MARQIESKLSYIKRKLISKAYNNAELSRATGITNAHLSNIASGDVKKPSDDTVERIFDYFKGLK
jgi:DNA-binding Xre family transcriptional regulator